MSYNVMLGVRDMTRWAVGYAMLVVIATRRFRKGNGWYQGTYQQRTRQNDFIFHIFIKKGELVEWSNQS
jgi:hypothetical protein